MRYSTDSWVVSGMITCRYQNYKHIFKTVLCHGVIFTKILAAVRVWSWGKGSQPCFVGVSLIFNCSVEAYAGVGVGLEVSVII